MKGLAYAAAIIGTIWGTSELVARLAWAATLPTAAQAKAPLHLDERSFTFCRVAYRQVRREPLGQGWRTDYPDGDRNLMLRLSQLTKTPIRQTQHGEPDHRIVQIMDDELFECPFIFMSDVGTIGIDPEEAERLRLYLEQGGSFGRTTSGVAWPGKHGRARSPRRSLPPNTRSVISRPAIPS